MVKVYTVIWYSRTGLAIELSLITAVLQSNRCFQLNNCSDRL